MKHNIRNSHLYVLAFCSPTWKLYILNHHFRPTSCTNPLEGRAIAEAVSRWLPTAVARVRARVWQVGFVVDKMVPGQVYSEYFDFPCQSSFHQILHPHNHPGQVQ
jgi:hypothetical protein